VSGAVFTRLGSVPSVGAMLPGSTSGRMVDPCTLGETPAMFSEVDSGKGMRRAPRSQSGTAVVREVQVRDIETVREWIRRPNEKNGMDRPSRVMVKLQKHCI
jgi:hypothetical protein